MDEDEEYETDVPQPAPWSWVTFGSVLVNAVGAGVRLVGTTISQVSGYMDSHVEYGHQVKRNHEQAAREMEALIAGVERIPADGVAPGK